MQPVDPMRFLNSAAVRYWVQNGMALISRGRMAPRELPRYSTLLLRRLQRVDCTQYMTTRTAILDIETDLNQWLEEIAKKEAPFNVCDGVFQSPR